MTSVLGYARTFFVGGKYRPDSLPSLQDEIARFHDMLQDLADHIEAGTELREGMTAERLLQGPFFDAMGFPVPPENFIVAEINAARLGPDQADPVSPDVVWPEAPSTWMPPAQTG
jgi:hypothetical protein